MGNADKDKIIEEFTKAYQKANGKTPTIEAKSGWYSVDGGKNVRLSQLEEMTASLAGEAKAPAPKKEEAKKAAPAKKEKPAAKPKAKAKAKAKSGFSVKAFWQEKLENENPGSRAPR